MRDVGNSGSLKWVVLHFSPSFQGGFFSSNSNEMACKSLIKFLSLPRQTFHASTALKYSSPKISQKDTRSPFIDGFERVFNTLNMSPIIFLIEATPSILEEYFKYMYLFWHLWYNFGRITWLYHLIYRCEPYSKHTLHNTFFMADKWRLYTCV